ncbi:DNA/RNA non-specific endonuclease [Thalassolituus sp. LLYu03]|uniref:DNA/RNA non-specific endonuclease n=1 Tax=Thalassolituus sp. LLYu03 TaxID=3421656 RepID=UPI003D29F443
MNRFILFLFFISYYGFSASAVALSLKDCRLSPDAQLHSLNEHVFGGRPDATPLYARHGYALSYNREYHVPRWVSWHASPAYRDTPKRTSRWSQFRTDPDFNDVTDKDYAGWFNTPYNFARGHLVPYFISGGDRDGDGKDAEFEGTLEVEDADDACTVFEINALSNITPQYHERFNGEKGLWYQLEALERRLLDQGHSYYAYAGTIFMGDIPVMRIGNRKKSPGEWRIGVPHGFYKVLIDAQQKRTYAFLFDHEQNLHDGCDLDSSRAVTDCLVPLSVVEGLTSMTFFTALPADQQRLLRQVTDAAAFNDWLAH